MQYVEVVIDIHGRMLELRALLLGGGNDSVRIQIEQVTDEFVGMLSLDTERRQRIVRKISLIEGDDNTGTTSNGGGEHVSVVWVR